MKGMNFEIFVQQIKQDAVEFEKGKEWDAHKWNEMYKKFLEWYEDVPVVEKSRIPAIKHAKEYFRNQTKGRTLAKDGFKPIRKEQGWYDSTVSLPEIGQEVYVVQESDEGCSQTAIKYARLKHPNSDEIFKSIAPFWRPAYNSPRSLKK